MLFSILDDLNHRMEIYEITAKPHLKLRIFATLIDYGIYLAIFWLYCSVFGTTTSDGSWEVTGWPALPIFLLWFAYFPGMEALNGATPGHDIFKLKVVTADGIKPGFGTALKRRICDPLDIGIWGLPAIILVSKTAKHQRIGDILAGTLVVKKEDITEKEISFK